MAEDLNQGSLNAMSLNPEIVNTNLNDFIYYLGRSFGSIVAKDFISEKIDHNYDQILRVHDVEYIRIPYGINAMPIFDSEV